MCDVSCYPTQLTITPLIIPREKTASSSTGLTWPVSIGLPSPSQVHWHRQSHSLTVVLSRPWLCPGPSMMLSGTHSQTPIPHAITLSLYDRLLRWRFLSLLQLRFLLQPALFSASFPAPSPNPSPSPPPQGSEASSSPPLCGSLPRRLIRRFLKVSTPSLMMNRAETLCPSDSGGETTGTQFP